MNNTKILLSSVAAITGLLACNASAAPLVTGTSSTGVFAVSASDLINGNPGILTGNKTIDNDLFAQTGNNPGLLTDGVFGSANPNQDPSRVGGTPTTLAIGSGAVLTYTLNTASNPGGFNIQSITTFGGWQDGGRDEQEYTLAFSLVGAPSTFIDYTFVRYDGTSGNVPSNTRVQITDDATGLLASGVAAIRFTFSDQENDHAGYREFDVVGSPVPEPGTVGLLALSTAGFMALRRRRA